VHEFSNSSRPRRREVCAFVLASPLLLSARQPPATPSRDVEVESFRQGYMSDRQVIQEAFAAWDQRAGGSFVFGESRTYEVGPLDSNAPPFVLDGAAGLSILGNGAQLLCDTIAGVTPVFVVRRSHGVSFADLRLHDRGYRPRVEWQGAVLIRLDGSAGPSTDIALTRLEANGAVGLCVCGGTNPQGRVSRISLTDVFANNCYYGVNFQENGDDLRCSMRADNCRRAYFCYGVANHRADLSISGDATGVGSDGCIVVARFERDTSDIAIQARVAGELKWSNLVHFVQIPPPGSIGHISDVSVVLDVDPRAVDRAGGRDASFTVYDKPGGQPVAVSASVWRNVIAKGTGIGGRQVIPMFDTLPSNDTRP
jgi:hypothetical protein